MSKKQAKSLHVLFTGLVFPKVVTGGDQLFLDIGPRLPKDIRITVITPHFAKEYWEGIDTRNITLKYLPPNPFEFKGNPIWIMLSYVIRSFQTYKILRREDEIQTIYSCSDIAYADIWPAYWYLKKNRNTKWLSRIYHVLLSPKERQGNRFTNIFAYRLQRLSFRLMKKRSSTIFALNDKLYDEVLDLGFPKNKLDILGAGIDYKKINNHKITKHYSYDAVALGRTTPVKGIFDAVKIWEKVHAELPGATMAWIGGGDDSIKERVENQLKSKGLSDSFTLLGYIDKDEVYNVLHTSKVFLCPDHENGWGLAVCEAMASGLPVVSYDLDIFGGVYKKGFVTAPLFDTDQYAHELVRLLKNDDERLTMSEDAVQQASEFDHMKVINKLVNYL